MERLYRSQHKKQQQRPSSPCPGRRRSSASLSSSTGGGSRSFSLQLQHHRDHHDHDHHRGLYAAPTSSFGIGWSVGLNVESVEKLLCESIPLYLDNVEEKRSLTSRFKGLASRCKKRSRQANSKRSFSQGATSSRGAAAAAAAVEVELAGIGRSGRVPVGFSQQ